MIPWLTVMLACYCVARLVLVGAEVVHSDPDSSRADRKGAQKVIGLVTAVGAAGVIACAYQVWHIAAEIGPRADLPALKK